LSHAKKSLKLKRKAKASSEEKLDPPWQVKLQIGNNTKILEIIALTCQLEYIQT
jgi:hypothetical protein